ncbi:hypothetical protein SAMN05444007_103376 [Cribrihabitans marinus]|uniref:Uncharacterized protein n=1 Tax=Cribrihabitans marinus TaxID=1227549 RepID=A0A1H6WJ72_9RHOB|nr:hypothetical protein GCM10010973_11170 [Cribrihabitans marinus]SEJ12405.1 hypothetical protein SAMN05444007_103376 [Cribrihabitans marinus]
MKCLVMKDLTDADYVAAGVSNHRILQMNGMTDEQRIRFLGLDVMVQVIFRSVTLPTMQRNMRIVGRMAMIQHLNDCDSNRRLGHLPPL